MNKLSAWLKENWLLPVAMALVTIMVVWLRNSCFFWDSIALISVPAHYLYENGLFHVIMPEEVNVCIATLPQWYTAFVWSMYGESLEVTHMAYLPIALCVVCGIWRLCKLCVKGDGWKWAFILIMTDGTLLAQCTGLMPDVFLMATLVWTINCILEERRWWGLLAMLLMAMVSDRGMLMAGAIMMWGLVRSIKKSDLKEALIRYWWVVLPTLIYILGFVVIQRVADGYWLVNVQENNPWSEYWQWSDWKGVLKNMAVTVWQVMSNGRVCVLGALLLLVIVGRRKVEWNRDILLLILCVAGVMLLATLPFCNPISARYYMIVNVLVVTTLVNGIQQLMNRRWVIAMVGIMAFCNVYANTVDYPERMAVAWDCTLGHIPYYELREELATEIDARGVDYLKVGVPFPMTNKLKFTYLNGEERRYSSIDFENNELVVYTNIGNLDDETIEVITQLPLLWRKQKGNVFIELHAAKP